jgi:ribonuclease P/MRP protein subunit POP1
VVLQAYEAEKKLRMQSAAVQAEAVAVQTGGMPITPSSSAPSSAKPAPTSAAAGPPQGQYTTTCATWDNGKITLRGNPLKSLKENYCPSCKLPRLMFPLSGVGMRLPEDFQRQYCTLHPFIRKPGHDIYGNPFPVDAGKTKKEREALRKLERQEKDNTPGSADTGADGDGVDAVAVRKLMAGGKGASYIPWHTCPNCKRSLLITKFAQHLEKCMGIGGRSARNAAAARLSGINGSANGSTQGSRVGTPTPSQTNGKRTVDDDDDDEPPKKKVKKDKKDKRDKHEKVEKKEKISIKLKMKNGGDSSTSKPSKLSSSLNADKSSKDRESNGKRERDDGGENDSPNKKVKVEKTDRMMPPEIAAGAQ